MVAGFLYYFRSNPLTNPIFEDHEVKKLVVPSKKRTQFPQEVHDVPQAGHLGIEKSYQKEALTYYWPGIFLDTVDYVRKCNACEMTKTEQQAPLGLMGKKEVEQPWPVVSAGCMGSYTRSKA